MMSLPIHQVKLLDCPTVVCLCSSEHLWFCVAAFCSCVAWWLVMSIFPMRRAIWLDGMRLIFFAGLACDAKSAFSPVVACLSAWTFSFPILLSSYHFFRSPWCPLTTCSHTSGIGSRRVISTISFTTSYSDARPAPANLVALASASLILVINPWLSVYSYTYPWLCRKWLGRGDVM
jgi:hypothetical protein